MSRIMVSLGHTNVRPWGAHLNDLLGLNIIDTMRINTARWPLDHLTEALQVIREHRNPVRVLIDFGQKLRLRITGGDLTVEPGLLVKIRTRPGFDKISFNRDLSAERFAAGEPLIMRDGKVTGEVVDQDDGTLTIRLTTVDPHEPFLNDMSGITFPRKSIARSLLEEKEHAVLDIAGVYKADMIASSFVESTEDAISLARAVCEDDEKRGRQNTVAVYKIESKLAVRDIHEILSASLAFDRSVRRQQAAMVMIARGDLYVEGGPLALARNQRRITKACTNLSVPFIAATGYLRSMMWGQEPSRAEVIDVDTAVRSGASHVMLAEEAGPDVPHAVRVVETLHTIIENALLDS